MDRSSTSLFASREVKIPNSCGGQASSRSHVSRKPTERFWSVALGYDKLACRAFQRKMRHARNDNQVNIHMCRPTFSYFQSTFDHPDSSTSREIPPAQVRISKDGMPAESLGAKLSPCVCATQPSARQLLSKNPQIPVASDHSKSTLSSDSSSKPSAHFSASASLPIVLSSFQTDGPTPPCSHWSLEIPNCTHHRSLPRLAIDPVHHRLPVASDFHLDLLAFCWSSENHRIQVPRFPVQSMPVVFLVDFSYTPEPHVAFCPMFVHPF